MAEVVRLVRARSGRVTLGLLAWVAAGCGSTASVSPERVALEERRLLQPYQEDRAVVADELHIEISANFDDEVTRPAAGGEHRFSHEKDGDDVVSRWINGGGLVTPLRFRIGETDLVALQVATVRVRGSGDFALSTRATGDVTEAVGDGEPVQCAEVRIEDGRHVRR